MKSAGISYMLLKYASAAGCAIFQLSDSTDSV
jgi:hypothetical protein